MNNVIFYFKNYVYVTQRSVRITEGLGEAWHKQVWKTYWKQVLLKWKLFSEWPVTNSDFNQPVVKILQPETNKNGEMAKNQFFKLKKKKKSKMVPKKKKKKVLTITITIWNQFLL